MITASGDRLIRRTDNMLAVAEPYGPNCIRCRITRNMQVSEEKWTLLEPRPAECEINIEGDCASLTVGDLRLDFFSRAVRFPGCIVISRKGEPVLRQKFYGDPDNTFAHVEGCNYKTTVVFESNEGEHFYGLGQEQQDWFDRKGGAYPLMHFNTKTTIPYLYSSLGYGFLWNNPAPGVCECTKNHTLWSAESTYQADFLVFSGDTPADVARTYCELTGFASPLPDWADGFWQCILRYEDRDELLSVAREYVKRGIPLDAIVIDYFHWTEQGEWRFDPKYWPDPEGMCAELREMGIEPVVSVWPTINPNSRNFKRMSEEGMLVRTEDGQYGTMNFHGQQTYVDPTNPDARKYMWSIVRENYLDKGFNNFWLDVAEPEVHPQKFGHLHFYKGNGAQTAMLYPYYYCKLFYEGLRSSGEEKIALLTRSAYVGSQRFGAVVWNGDIPSTWKALRQSVVSGLSMAVCGLPWWNSDIGGFSGGNIESEDFRELIVRWFQFGLFCPVMRLHGFRRRIEGEPARNPGIIEPSGGPNEIWRFGEKAYDIICRLIRLRQRLRPYIKEQMALTVQSGMPLMQPMFYRFPDDERCYEVSDQYFFGSEILFAPVTDKGALGRKVYLPKGRWVLARDGSVYEGGRDVCVPAELSEFIAFLPEGSGLLGLFKE